MHNCMGADVPWGGDARLTWPGASHGFLQQDAESAVVFPNYSQSVEVLLKGSEKKYPVMVLWKAEPVYAHGKPGKKKKKKLYEGFGFPGKAAVQILLW